MNAMLERLKRAADLRPVGARVLVGHRPPTRTRQAFSVVEMSVAIVILATLLSLSVKGLSALSASQRRIEQQGWAVQTAASALEQATGHDPTELDSAFVERMPASTQVQQTLPGGRLTIDVSKTPSARRVTVTVGWNDRAGMPVAPVRLSAWLYSPAQFHPLAQIVDTPAEEQPTEANP